MTDFRWVIPGLRVKETFEMKLPEKGVRLKYQNRVSQISQDKDGFLNWKPVFGNLFAAGSILAHQDWVRMKCGSGMATAYAAVDAFISLFSGLN